MKRIVLFSIILFSALLAIGQDTIQLSTYVGNLKKLAVRINAHPYSFLFDTGGGETFISSEIVKAIGGHAYGNVLGLRMSGEKVYSKKCDSVTLEMGNRTFFHSSIGVWDIMNVLPEGLPKLDGIISLKTFANSILTIDLAANRLVVETAGSAAEKIKQMKKLEPLSANGASAQELLLFIPIVQQHPYWFLFDSGNLDDITLSPTTAKEWGIDTALLSRTTLAIPFAGKNINAGIIVKDIIYDGAVNFAFIRQAVYLVNCKSREVWVQE
jgi:hypothetical protein